MLAVCTFRALSPKTFSLLSRQHWSAAIDALADGSPAIVVLGQSLNPDGSTPKTLLCRAEAAASLHFSSANYLGVRPPVIATGGDPVGAGTSEAEVMGLLLRGHGVPESKIRLEHRAQNTLQNAWEILPMLPKGCERILLVTSDFHMPRAAYLFEAVLASRGLNLTVVQHPVDINCRAARSTPDLNPTVCSAINAQSTLKRLQNEARFIRDEVEQIGLKQHIPGTEIQPLPEWRLKQALMEVEELLNRTAS